MTFLLEHWLAFASLLIALAFGAAVVHWQRRGVWAWSYYLPALILASYGLGAIGLLPEWWLGLALALTAFIIFVLLLVMVIATGYWSAPAGNVLACLFFFGLGDFSATTVADGLRLASVFLVSIRAQEPWWLLLLLVVPILCCTSWRNLAMLGTTRRWLVLGLRCALFVLLAGALAEAYARRPNEGVTVLFVWDRSLSMPPEFDRGKDLREKRIFDFINDSVAKRGPAHANDRVGVIVFGKQPRLELPPHRVPKLGFNRVLSEIDATYTDIDAAMKLALASFPEGAGKRIVLISDGNENRGRAEDQARIARQNGVQVDVLPIAAGRKHQNEILVERIEVPPVTQKDARLPLRVVIRSFHPQVVVAQLKLRKITFDPALDLKQDDKDSAKNSTIVKLRQGLNVYSFQQAGAKDDTVFAYEATVDPLRVETEAGALVHQVCLATASITTRRAPSSCRAARRRC